MRKVVAFFVVSLSLTALINAQTLEEKERELYKKYNVKARTNWDYSYTSGKIAKQGKKASYSTYNINGQILSSQTFNPQGQVFTSERYEYDKNGNRTLYERQSLSGEYKKESEYNITNNLIEEYGYDGSAKFRTALKYDDKNRVSEITYYIADEIDEKRGYRYEKNNTATVEILKGGKNLTSKVGLTFNSNNQVVSEETKNLEGKILETKKYDYTASGNILKEEKYRNGEMFYRISYVYDTENNLMTVSEESKTEAKFVKKKYIYDSQNRIVEYQWKRSPDDEYNIKTFKYGDSGVCVEENTYYPKTEYKLLTKYEYEFYQ